MAVRVTLGSMLQPPTNKLAMVPWLANCSLENVLPKSTGKRGCLRISPMTDTNVVLGLP